MHPYSMTSPEFLKRFAVSVDPGTNGIVLGRPLPSIGAVKLACLGKQVTLPGFSKLCSENQEMSLGYYAKLCNAFPYATAKRARFLVFLYSDSTYSSRMDESVATPSKIHLCKSRSDAEKYITKYQDSSFGIIHELAMDPPHPYHSS